MGMLGPGDQVTAQCVFGLPCLIVHEFATQVQRMKSGSPPRAVAGQPAVGLCPGSAA